MYSRSKESEYVLITIAPLDIAKTSNYIRRLFVSIFRCVVGIFILSSCQAMTLVTTPPTNTDFYATYDTAEGGNQVFIINMDTIKTDTFAYSINIPVSSGGAEVYIISTNTSSVSIESPKIRTDNIYMNVPRTPYLDTFPYIIDDILPTHGRMAVTEFNNKPPLPSHSRSVGNSSVSQPNYSSSDVGDKFVFTDHDGSGPYDIPSTARHIIFDNTVPTSVTIWVADDTWDDGQCDKTYCVTQSMVNIIADRFLKLGNDNDIYDWIGNIFGLPWGHHSYNGLLDPSTNDIHILLFDIDADNSITGGMVGFFWAKDNYIKDPSDPYLGTSNERLMFYLDSVLLATPEMDYEWDISHFWPSSILGAMAHEFQHMIHFYEKTIVHDAVSETWLNELCSEVAEDLVANKISVYGPRGVDPADGSGGHTNNSMGRLPLYNMFNYIQVTKWESFLSNYSINYALGAYLVRSYGTSLFTDIVQNEQSGTAAIESALGNSLTFGEILSNWAVANILSDDLEAHLPYRYNTGDWISSSSDNVDYSLGSINLFNYEYDELQNGPLFFNPDSLNEIEHQPPHSNIYVSMGHHSGVIEGHIDYDPGTNIAIIIKE